MERDQRGQPGPARPLEILPNVSDLRLDGANLTNVAGDINIYHDRPAGVPDAMQHAMQTEHNRGTAPVLPQPIRSENTIYCSNLLGFERGYPLLNPTPQQNLPVEYRKSGIRIGDVGRVTPEGGFDFLFNIYLPADDRHGINGNRVPVGFYPLAPYHQIDVSVEELRRGSFASPSVAPRCRDLDVADIELEFTCFGPSGAFLVLPQGSRLSKLENTEAMCRYAAKHAESWYFYANDTRGRRIVNGGLYLVTGHEKATFCGMTTFQNIGRGREFDIAFVPLHREDGSIKYAFSRGDPARTRTFATAPPADFNEPNNTVFVQGLTISLGKSIFQRLLGKGVSFAPIGEKPYSNSQEGWIPFGTQASSFALPFGQSSRSGPTIGRQAAIGAHEVVIGDICAPAAVHHPSLPLHKALCDKYPKASVVVVHDDVWIHTLRNNGGPDIESSLIDRVLERFKVIHGKEGTVFLTQSRASTAHDGPVLSKVDSQTTPAQVQRSHASTPTRSSRGSDSHRGAKPPSLAARMTGSGQAAATLPPLIQNNTRVLTNVLESLRTMNKKVLTSAYPGFPDTTCDLVVPETLGHLYTSHGYRETRFCVNYSAPQSQRQAGDYWEVKFDGQVYAAFSVPLVVARRLRDFRFNAQDVLFCLLCSLQAGGRRVELEIGDIASHPASVRGWTALVDSAQLKIRVQHDTAVRNNFTSSNHVWPLGYQLCGKRRCKRVFNDGSGCEKHCSIPAGDKAPAAR